MKYCYTIKEIQELYKKYDSKSYSADISFISWLDKMVEAETTKLREPSPIAPLPKKGDLVILQRMVDQPYRNPNPPQSLFVTVVEVRETSVLVRLKIRQELAMIPIRFFKSRMWKPSTLLIPKDFILETYPE